MGRVQKRDAISAELQKQIHFEFQNEQRYLDYFEQTFNLELVKRQNSKFQEILEYLHKVEKRLHGIKLTESHELFLIKTRNQIHRLRFGHMRIDKDLVRFIKGGHEISYRHWLVCINFINNLLKTSKKVKLIHILQSEEIGY